jgi:hypothetical protein
MQKSLFIISLGCLLSTGLLAQPKSSNDEKGVATAVEVLRKAMVDGDKKALESVAAEELSYGHSSGRVEDKASFVTSLTNGTSDFVSINIADQTIKITGNTAIVRYKMTGDTNDNNKPGTVNLGVLLVWQKQKGQWKLLARQAFKL